MGSRRKQLQLKNDENRGAYAPTIKTPERKRDQCLKNNELKDFLVFFFSFSGFFFLVPFFFFSFLILINELNYVSPTLYLSNEQLRDVKKN